MLRAQDALLSAMVMLKTSARQHTSQRRNLLATTQADTQRVVCLTSALSLCGWRRYIRSGLGAPAGTYLGWHIVVASIGDRCQTVLAHTAGWDQDTADLAAPDRRFILHRARTRALPNCMMGAGRMSRQRQTQQKGQQPLLIRLTHHNVRYELPDEDGDGVLEAGFRTRFQHQIFLVPC
jgi:hypothetical protein